MIKFTRRPAFNQSAEWQPTAMKVDGIRVWTRLDKGANCNLNRVGRYGDKYFYSWSGFEPNYL